MDPLWRTEKRGKSKMSKYSYSIDGSDYEGSCDTREEAMVELAEHLSDMDELGPGDLASGGWTGEMVPVSPSLVSKGLGGVLFDFMEDRLADLTGGCGRAVDATDEDVRVLDAAVKEVVEKWLEGRIKASLITSIRYHRPEDLWGLCSLPPEDEG